MKAGVTSPSIVLVRAMRLPDMTLERCDHGRDGPAGAVAELTRSVAAPAPHARVGAQAAGVRHPDRERRPVGEPGHAYRCALLHAGAVADLAILVVAPAPGLAAAQPARVQATHRDRR